MKSLTADFYPKLYVSLLDTARYNNTPDFPPTERLNYTLFTAWDHDLYALKTSLTFSNLSSSSRLALNL